jgi:alcohol dehydrogenase
MPTMLALQYSEFRGSIDVVSLDVPQPGDLDCVIKVFAAGLCRSDWHGWQGHDPDISTFPHTPGHEFAGEVHAVGRCLQAFMHAFMTPFCCVFKAMAV